MPNTPPPTDPGAADHGGRDPAGGDTAIPRVRVVRLPGTRTAGVARPGGSAGPAVPVVRATAGAASAPESAPGEVGLDAAAAGTSRSAAPVGSAAAGAQPVPTFRRVTPPGVAPSGPGAVRSGAADPLAGGLAAGHHPRRVLLLVTLTLLAVTAVVLGIAVGMPGRTGGASSAGRDPAGAVPLRLDDPATSAAEIDTGDAGEVRVAGPLPAGPGRGRVYRFGNAGGADPVERLADVFGLSGRAVSGADGWTVTGAGRVLTVGNGPGRPWLLAAAAGARDVGDGTAPPARCVPGPASREVCRTRQPAAAASCRAGPAAGSGTCTATAVPGGGVLPLPLPAGAPPRVTSDVADRVRGAARPVLDALGLGTATVRITGTAAQCVLTATPTLDGLPTAGAETSLVYDRATRVGGGRGWLAAAAAAEEYPLVPAGRALRALRTLPVTDGSPRPLVVTGAHTGLALRTEFPGRRPLLVPAWLYDVRGADLPLVAVAVDPASLAPAAGDTDPNGTDPAGDGSVGSAGSAGSGGAAPATGPAGRPGPPDVGGKPGNPDDPPIGPDTGKVPPAPPLPVPPAAGQTR